MEEVTGVDTKLRVLRIGHKWSQDQVAEKIGITQAAYAKLEAGKTRLTVDRAKQLADLYEIDPEYFFSQETIHATNSGPNSHGGIYHNSSQYHSGIDPDVMQQLIADRNSLFQLLTEELKEARKERQEFIRILDSLKNKKQ